LATSQTPTPTAAATTANAALAVAAVATASTPSVPAQASARPGTLSQSSHHREEQHPDGDAGNDIDDVVDAEEHP